MKNRHIVSVSLLAIVLSVCMTETSGANTVPMPEITRPDQLITKGEEFHTRGNLESAIRSWEKALSLSEPGTETYLQILARLTQTYQAVGHHQKALTALREALPLMEKSSNPYHKALFFGSFADIYLSLGKTEQALAYADKAVEAARLTQDTEALASVLNHKGNVLTVKRDYEGAAAAYRESLDLIEQLGNVPRLKSKVLINMARVASYHNKDQADMSTSLEKALRHIRNLPDSHHKAAELLSLSLIPGIREGLHFKSRFRKIAFEALSEASRIAKAIEDARMTSYTYGYLGQLYESEGRYSEAAKLTRSAIFHAQKGHFPEILYLWQWQLGRLFKAGGDIEQAAAAYNNAIRILGPVRGELLREYRRQNVFSERIRPVYLGFAELLLKQAETAQNEESRKNKLREARDIMEILKTAELEDFFEDECVTAMQEKLTTLDTALPGTAIVYPIALPDKLALLLTLPDGMKQITVPVDSAALEETVRNFQGQLQSRRNYKYKKSAKQLYDWLIRPAEAELTAQNIDTLIVAPDGALRLIPFSALHDGEHFLVERYAVVTVPAVTLTDPKPLEHGNIAILANGLSEARQGFAPLPNVPRELENIKTVAGAKTLQDQEYTIDNLTNEFKNHAYPVVHIASHGVFGSTAKETFLLSYDDRLTMDRLEELIHIGRFRETPVELLTLSACQTALGDERAALGLAGVAIKAGVRSALASLWLVDDEATYMMMSEFYRHLKSSDISKAKALQNAQKGLIAQKRYQHPAYWAPFLLIGNWL